eukprot:14703563-Alexandrium_andersonii.AAC.1
MAPPGLASPPLGPGVASPGLALPRAFGAIAVHCWYALPRACITAARGGHGLSSACNVTRS